MPPDTPPIAADPWSIWLSHDRHAGDPALRAHIAAETLGFAHKILGAVPAAPASMLDIGSGEGLMAWAALARWPGVQVTCTDISAPLLAMAQADAQARGLAGQCAFRQTAAEQLNGVDDASQDLVTSRSALAYVADKPAAFNAAWRVLKPGGLLSIAEPLFREEALTACVLHDAVAHQPNQMLVWLHKWKAAQFPDTQAAMAASPLTNYTERDMLQFARQAGFSKVHLELHIDAQPAPPRSWAVFTAVAPHPLAPSLARILDETFSPRERDEFTAALRPEIEAGCFNTTGWMLYLSARKPG
jgi:ubiquinone/menaquinone biosynthesis C-methylase UbiE